MKLTINELVSKINKAIVANKHPSKRNSLIELKSELVAIKQSPELFNSCNIDFKLSNSDFYLQRLKNIIENN